MRDRQREEGGDTDNPLDITLSADRERERRWREDGWVMEGRKEGGGEESKNFFWSSFCNIEALAGERGAAMNKWGGEEKKRKGGGGEDDRDAGETAPLSHGFDVGWG